MKERRARHSLSYDLESGKHVEASGERKRRASDGQPSAIDAPSFVPEPNDLVSRDSMRETRRNNTYTISHTWSTHAGISASVQERIHRIGE